MKRDKLIDILGLVGLGLAALGTFLSGWSSNQKIDRKIEERERKLNAKSDKES